MLILIVSGIPGAHVGEGQAPGRGTVSGRNATLRLGVWRGDVDADLNVITAAARLFPGVKYSVNSSTYEVVGSYIVVEPYVCGR